MTHQIRIQEKILYWLQIQESLNACGLSHSFLLHSHTDLPENFEVRYKATLMLKQTTFIWKNTATYGSKEKQHPRKVNKADDTSETNEELNSNRRKLPSPD